MLRSRTDLEDAGKDKRNLEKRLIYGTPYAIIILGGEIKQWETKRRGRKASKNLRTWWL